MVLYNAYLHPKIVHSFQFQVISWSSIMGLLHRSVKWWKRVFFHLLDLAVVNSHLLFRSVTGSRMSQLDFRLAVAKSLTEGLERPHPRRSAGSRELPVRLTERPFPEPVPEGKRPDCVVCSNRGVGQRHQTGYIWVQGVSHTLVPIPLL